MAPLLLLGRLPSDGEGAKRAKGNHVLSEQGSRAHVIHGLHMKLEALKPEADAGEVILVMAKRMIGRTHHLRTVLALQCRHHLEPLTLRLVSERERLRPRRVQACSPRRRRTPRSRRPIAGAHPVPIPVGSLALSRATASAETQRPSVRRRRTSGAAAPLRGRVQEILDSLLDPPLTE